MKNSTIFGTYNRLRKVARLNPGMVSMQRLNKALSIAQSHRTLAEKVEAYHPTTCTCGCKDQQYSFAPNRRYTGPCKHELAVMLVSGVVLA
jgi:hypothetical protein